MRAFSLSPASLLRVFHLRLSSSVCVRRGLRVSVFAVPVLLLVVLPSCAGSQKEKAQGQGPQGRKYHYPSGGRKAPPLKNGRRKGRSSPLLLGGAAFLLLLWAGVLFPLSPIGWCCVSSSLLLGGAAFFCLLLGRAGSQNNKQKINLTFEMVPTTQKNGEGRGEGEREGWRGPSRLRGGEGVLKTKCDNFTYNYNSKLNS